MTVAAVCARPRDFQSDTAAAGDDSKKLAVELRIADFRLGGVAQNWEDQLAAAAEAIRAECSVPNWDGDQAAPVTPEAIALAQRLARLFYCYVPRQIPAPDLIPEADGEVSMSWTRDRNRMFAVSIGNHNKLNYAGRLGGGDEPHDVVVFDAQDPSAIQQMAAHISTLFK